MPTPAEIKRLADDYARASRNSLGVPRKARASLYDAIDAQGSGFSRGWYEEGVVTAQVHSLFKQGGGVLSADPMDLELFAEHGLVSRQT